MLATATLYLISHAAIQSLYVSQCAWTRVGFLNYLFRSPLCNYVEKMLVFNSDGVILSILAVTAVVRAAIAGVSHMWKPCRAATSTKES